MKIGNLFEIDGCLVRLGKIGHVHRGTMKTFEFNVIAGTETVGGRDYGPELHRGLQGFGVNYFWSQGYVEDSKRLKKAKDPLLYVGMTYKTQEYLELLKS